MSLQIGSITATLDLDSGRFIANAGQAESAMSHLEKAGNGLFDKAGKSVESFSQKIDRLGPSITTVGTTLAGFGAVITAGFGAAAKVAIDFGEQMANVNSIAQLSAGELDKVSQAVLDLSRNTGQGPATLAAGLYDIYSSGFEGAEGLKVLTQAANAANAGLTNTAVSAKAITAVLNAYHLNADDAAHVSDVLFQTVNEGVISFEQLATNMGNTLPLGNALGVSFEELGAAYARLTLSGIGASQAETQIAALMRAAINPTTDLTAAIKDYGYESASALIAAEGFTGYLEFLGKASGGSQEELFNLLGTTEAVNAALVLGGDNIDGYIESLNRMRGASDGAGATQIALAEQAKSTAFQLRKLKATMQVFAIAIGSKLEPAIRFAANALNTALNGFLALPKGVQTAIAAVVGITGAAAAFGGALLLIVPRILEFQRAMAAIGGMRGVFSILTAGIPGLRALSLAFKFAGIAAIAGTAAYATNFLGFRDFTHKVIDTGKGVLGFFGDLKDKWDDLGHVFGGGGGKAIRNATSPLSALQRALGGTKDELGDTADEANAAWKGLNKFQKVTYVAEYALGRLIDSNAPDWLKDIATNAKRAIPQIRYFGNFLGDLWSGSPRKAMQSLADLSPSLQKIAKNLAPAVTGVRDLVSAFQIGGFGAFLRELPQAFGMIGDSIDLFLRQITGGLSIKDWTLTVAAPKIAGWLKDIAPDVWDGLVKVAGWAWDGLVELGGWVLSVGVPTVIGAISSIWDSVSSWVTDTAWPAVKDTAIAIGDVLLNIGSWAAGAAVSLWPRVAAMAQTAWDAAKTAAITVWDVLTNIGSWAQGIVSDIWPYIKAFAASAWDTAKSGAVTLWGVLTNIGSWAKGIVSDIWPYIKSFAADAWSTAKETAVTIWGVLTNIGSWAKGIVSDIWPYVKTFASDAWEAIKDTAYTVWGVLVDIGSYTKGTVADIGTAIDGAVTDAYNDYVAAGGYTSVDDVPVKVNSIEVDASGATISDKDEGDSWGNAGYKYGLVAGDKTIAGINKAFAWLTGTGGGSGGGGGSSLWGSIDNFMTSLSMGMQGVIDSGINELIDPGPATQALYNVLYAAFIQPFIDLGKNIQDIAHFFEPAVKNLIAPLKRLGELDFSGIKSGLGDIWDGFKNMMDLNLDFGPVSDAYNIFKRLQGVDWSALGRGIADFGETLGDFAGKVFDFGWIDDLTGKLTDLAGAFKSAADNKSIWDGVNGKELNPDDGKDYGPDNPLPEPIKTGGIAQLPQSVIDAIGGESGDGGALGRALANAKTVAETKMGEINTTVSTGLATIGTTISTQTTAWVTAVNNNLLLMQTGVMNSMMAITTNITTVMTNIATSISTQTMAWVTSSNTNLLLMQTGVMTSMSAINTNISTAMSSASTSISTEAGTWPGIIDGIAGPMESAGLKAGAAAGAGVVRGMDSMLGVIQIKASEIAAIVEHTINLGLEVNSPSKVTMRAGQAVGEGLILGMNQMQSPVAAAAQDLADTVKTQWQDIQLTGLIGGDGFDTSVGSIWSEADWLKRVQQLGEQAAKDVNSLFIGRTRLDDTNYSLLGGKYREHYGSGIQRGANPIPVVPVAPDTGQPLPDTPNNGSPNGSYRQGNAIPAVQQVTHVYVTPDSAQFSEFAANAQQGRIANGAIQQMGTRRTMRQGQSRVMGRM